MDKKILRPQSRTLVIEDEHGMRTFYYPALTWNSLGYSFSSEQKEIPAQDEGQIRLSRLAFLDQETQKSYQPFRGIDRSQKMYSVKNILQDISRRYDSVNRFFSYASGRFLPENQTYLHSDLLYLITASDGHKDTVGHSQLVARYTLLLTSALGIADRTFSVEIERGALLHDIGKIRIPDSILRKPGSLTDSEKEIIKEHPQLGYEMVGEFPFLQKASRVVLFHHESYDGGGYPFGLKGDEIPLEARIFAIADTLDAITSDRPYRRGKSFQAACDEIANVRGTQFDPSIVDAFLSVPEEKWQQIRRETVQSLSEHSIH
jgi:putative nucleotidyltransferase with HDIG domain